MRIAPISPASIKNYSVFGTCQEPLVKGRRHDAIHHACSWAHWITRILIYI